jgi:hypothetical protein
LEVTPSDGITQVFYSSFFGDITEINDPLWRVIGVRVAITITSPIGMRVRMGFGHIVEVLMMALTRRERVGVCAKVWRRGDVDKAIEFAI